MKRWGLLCVLCLVFAFSGVARGAEELKYFIAFKGANQRGFWEETIAEFEKENPDVRVNASFIEEEAYKVQLPGWLTTEAPDLIRWHAGERMAYYAERGLLEDISDLWTENNWDASFSPSLKDVSSYGGKQFAMPNDFFSWGFYYRKDLFEKSGIAGEPKTWTEFLDACAKLKAAGVMPIAVGGRDSWTLAAWFDYINFRLNGFEFHMQLMRGEIPYTDDRVKAVYAEWRKLLDAGYFIDNPLSYTLDSVQPLINQGQAGMMIMGTFITGGIPAEILEKLGYFQFPVINPELPIAEDGSVDCMNIPSRAKNKAAARRFLTHVSRPEVLGLIL